MRLSFIELEGFRGFREKVRLDFSTGFTVISGRNGSGKSTILDAIEFALSGTIDKFQVTSAKGGGLDDYFWWRGSGKPSSYAVTVGFLDDEGKPFNVTRTRTGGSTTLPVQILQRLSKTGASASSLETLLKTTLIRDEKIAALSLDLPEQSRFSAVRAAIGGLAGPDHSQRTASILEAAKGMKARQEQRIRESQTELGRLLGELVQAKSVADRAGDISQALHLINSQLLELAANQDTATRLVQLRGIVADKKLGLREIETARNLAVSLLPEVNFFASTETIGAVQKATANDIDLKKEKAAASERLQLALKAAEAEQESDVFAAHLASLLEHGHAVGLQDGHCPLCDAARTAEQFERAMSLARARLDSRGSKLAAARTLAVEAQAESKRIEEKLLANDQFLAEIRHRRASLEQNLARVTRLYEARQFDIKAENTEAAQKKLFVEQEGLVRLERALAILDSSNAVERVTSLEAAIRALRLRNESEAARLANIDRAIDSARQIDAASKTVANEILTEQFDTVMPLLKELYLRLRPHADWAEIESDFGGKVRGSLNFVVGEGLNPQFLFSSGQRRAAGLSFLLAVHMSRPWCAWNSLLLDDPVQHIDDYRALNLVEVLATIRRTGRQIIVAVEDVALGDLLCRRLRSERANLGKYYELRTSKTGTSEIASEREVYPMPHLVLRPAQAS